MPVWLIIIIVVVSVAAVGGLAFFFIRKAVKKRMAEQTEIVNQNKMVISLFVIEKKKAKINEVNLPKSVVDQIPKMLKMKKLSIVTAKIGPQVMPLICDDKVFNDIPEKTNVKVEIAGIFIVGVVKEKGSNKIKSSKNNRKKHR